MKAQHLLLWTETRSLLHETNTPGLRFGWFGFKPDGSSNRSFLPKHLELIGLDSNGAWSSRCAKGEESSAQEPSCENPP